MQQISILKKMFRMRSYFELFVHKIILNARKETKTMDICDESECKKKLVLLLANQTKVKGGVDNREIV